MASNLPFDEWALNSREKIKSTDVNGSGAMHDGALDEAIGALLGLSSAQLYNGAFGTLPDTFAVLQGLLVEWVAGLTVTVSPGIGFCKDRTAAWLTQSRSEIRALYLPAVATLVASAPAALSRIDRVIARPAFYLADVEPIDAKDPATGLYLPPANAFKRLRKAMRTGTYAQFVAGTCDLCFLDGTPAAVPVPPAVPADAVSLAQVRVPPAGVINDIKDERRPAFGPSVPAIRAYVKGSDAGAFAFPASVPIAQLFEAGGASISTVARIGVGEYVISTLGTEDLSAPDSLGHVQMTGVNPSLIYAYPTVKTVGSEHIGKYHIWTKDTAGAAADYDFSVTITGCKAASGGQY